MTVNVVMSQLWNFYYLDVFNMTSSSSMLGARSVWYPILFFLNKLIKIDRIYLSVVVILSKLLLLEHAVYM